MRQIEIPKLEQLSSYLHAAQVQRLFMVADQPAYEASGAAARLAVTLQSLDCDRFRDFAPNPQFDDAVRGLTQFRSAAYDMIIAIGGGTAIDLAKLVKCFGTNPSPPRDLILKPDQIQGAEIPLVAIPTTAGTGSEATQFAVVYLDDEKHSLAHPSLRPDVTVLDPTLTYSMPPGLTAATGLDALAQAMESIWSVRATDDSMNLAEQALRLGRVHLRAAVREPTPESRAAMCAAANFAGKAINISRTTAPHALSYAITSRFGVPHGIAVALTIAPFLRFNAAVSADNVNAPHRVDAAQAAMRRIQEAMGVETAEDAADVWLALLRDLGCPTRLAEVGIRSAAQREAVAVAVNAERLSNNPRRTTSADLLDLLAEVA